MIPRRSKSKCPAVRAVNDFMRHSGLSPDAETVREYIDAAKRCDVETTPEAFQAFWLAQPVVPL